MDDVQEQMQQKPEGEVEDFTHGHLDDCVRFGSCNSIHNTEDEGVQGEQLVRRRRRSDLDGDDLAESSAARRRHSRILSRWAARQAEITTIEMRNRETELMALARLHAVSMLDSSFLRESESPTSRSQGNVERYNTQASSILQMWRELEDESMVYRAEERVRERLRQQRILESSRNMPERRDNDNSLGDPLGNENEYATLSNRPISQNENREHERTSRGRSPVLDDVERERVRDIVRRWMGISDHSTNISMRSNHPREEWLGETERERVRIAREWVQMVSQHREANGGQRDEHNIGHATLVDDPAEDGSTIDPEGEPERLRINLMRQALIDLLVRIDREQQRELQRLVERRAVSHFAHRNRIQSLLIGRFSRTDELIQLRQRHTVSGLREGIRSRLESLVRRRVSSHSRSNNALISSNDEAPTDSSFEVQQDNSEQRQSRSQESDNLQNPPLQEHTDISVGFPRNLEGATDNGSGILEQSRVDEITTHPESAANTSSVERTLQDSATSWPSETPETNSGNERLLRVTRDAWHEDGSSEVGETWSERTSDPSRNRRPSRRFSRFHPRENAHDHVDNMELRELMSRRTVTSLDSHFRDSLDTLIQNYVTRQSQNPINWDLHRDLNVPATQDHNHRNENPDVDAAGPSPWQQDLHHSNYPRRTAHRSEIEWGMINDVRADVARLEQGMTHMRAILETCMEMQVELQRSIRQEVSAALNRSTNFFSFNSVGSAETSETEPMWSKVRNGTCCICCEDQIDSLLYRCGHMCTCSKCATELFKLGGKCPLCRAPIVEAVRAYSIE